MADSERYEVVCKIGQGSFGVINKVRRKSDGLVLCRKEISYLKMSQKEREQLQAELNILKELKHPNIVQYFERDHLKSTQDLYLYMEYCGNGDLGKVIGRFKEANTRAPEHFVWSIFTQLVTALYRCHTGLDPPEVQDCGLNGTTIKGRKPTSGARMCILHRDLKPENVFLDSENNVKLGDFGLSKIIQSHDFASTYVGTPYYMSPEVCGAERYSTASDIWSLGCLIYELCTWSPPFNARSHVELFSKIKTGRFAPLPPVYSSELSKVVQSCLQVNPNTRPDAARLLGLPMVSVMRKQIEAVQTHKALKLEIDLLRQKEADLRKKEEELNAKLQMEWEVRAQLEINKYVQAEKDRLEAIFEEEVGKRVTERVRAAEASASRRSSGETSQVSLGGKTLIEGNSSDLQPQKVAETGISFDVGRLSLESPSASGANPPQNLASALVDRDRSTRRRSRTPFVRSQTTIAPIASPMDVTMAEPSPMSIASLSLSPRKDNVSTVTGTQRRVSGNIFANAQARRTSQRWQAMNASPPASEFGDTDLATSFDDDEENEVLTKSPSREPSKRAKRISMVPGREGLATKRLTSAPALASGLPAPTANGQVRRPLSAVPVVSTSPLRQTKATAMAMESPIRNGAARKDVAGGSPVRKIVSTFRSKRGGVDAEAAGVVRAAVRAQNPVTGRSLVELAQARAGGVDRSAAIGLNGNVIGTKGAVQENCAAVWDPERDEMPSPFLARGRNVLRAALR